MSESNEIVTLGEAMVVMEPLSTGRLRSVTTFQKRMGGAEMNVAVALARLGHKSSWAGALGDDEFGREILSFTKGEGVDVSQVLLEPDASTGVYFKETGALGQRRAYYYRAGSAASRLRFEDVDLSHLLSTGMLHLSGITPALSDRCKDLATRLIEEAGVRGIPVSFDANIRWKLFKERNPKETIGPLLACADLLFLSEEEAELLLGTSAPRGVSEALKNMHAATAVVHGQEGAFATDGREVIEKGAYDANEVDPVGAGDAFAAGFLSGRLRGLKTEDCLNLANACGALAVTVPGDAESMPTEAEAMNLLHARTAVER